jgi:hypothetical protein
MSAAPEAYSEKPGAKLTAPSVFTRYPTIVPSMWYAIRWSGSAVYGMAQASPKQCEQSTTSSPTCASSSWAKWMYVPFAISSIAHAGVAATTSWRTLPVAVDEEPAEDIRSRHVRGRRGAEVGERRGDEVLGSALADGGLPAAIGLGLPGGTRLVDDA